MPPARFALLDDRAVLAVSGPDRVAFLQGLVSNDVTKLAPGRSLYAALLTAQGKYLHDFVMADAGEAIWLDAEAARISDLKRRLTLYRLRAKVALDEQPELAVAAAFDDGALAALGLESEPGGARPFGGGIALADPRLAALGARILLPRDGAQAALAAAGLVEADFAEWDRLRLRFGIPDGSRDLVVDKTILLEAGFDELHGVDWQKGCYVGQELTARTRYRGLIKRRLLPVQIDGTPPPAGTAVTADGRDAGEMRSHRDGTGLALLRLETITAPLAAGEAKLTALTPDWLRLPAEPQ